MRESDAANNTIALYTYDEDDRLVAIEKAHGSSWDIFYPHTNWRGDIIGVTNSAGTQVATYKYDPWGTLISKTGTFDTPIRYAGYYFDTETGMYYLKARYYSPEQGRFLTKDTFKGFNENPQSLNQYAYCEGNPIMKVDPSGHVAWWVASGAVGIAVNVGQWAFERFVLYPRPWNWTRDTRDLMYAITTGALAGVLVQYAGFKKVGQITFSIYNNIRWRVVSWSWNGGPPRSKWAIAQQLLSDITWGIISGLR